MLLLIHTASIRAERLMRARVYEQFLIAYLFVHVLVEVGDRQVMME
jgi:hypothetical protein